MAVPEASFHPVGGKRRFVGVGVWCSPPSPLQALLLYPPLWSPSKLLQYVPPGTSPEDHPGIEANTQCSPDLSPERVPLGAKQGLWSLVPGSLPGALQASRTENTVTRARGGTSGDGGSPPLSQHCLGCPAFQAASAFLQNWVRKWILATQKQV